MSATFSNVDPSNGEVIAEIPSASAAEIHRAVAEARAAAGVWALQPIEERGACLERFGELLAADAEALGALLCQEMGKTLRSAVGEVRSYASSVAEDVAQIREALAPQRPESKTQDVTVYREPLGVVAAITPWNFPVGMPLSILTPALVAGNAVVFKPSEQTPLTGARLAELLQQVLPEGVLQLLQGAGNVGAELVRSDVDMIGFVGSRDTGARIMSEAAGSLKRLVLELGGKDPLVVFEDADIEEAARCAVDHSLRNTGQVCCSIERVYVADAIADEFEARAVELARGWTHGDPRSKDTKMGPLVSAQQRDKVAAQVREAVDAGAHIALGGAPAEGPGHFYPATVLTGVAQDNPITHAETFGPVVAVTRFDGSEEEGVRMANDTIYGLGANVWTADAERAARVARRLRAGQVGVNRYLGGTATTPWVGARQSGFGFLGGADGHRQFTVPKTVSVAR